MRSHRSPLWHPGCGTGLSQPAAHYLFPTASLHQSLAFSIRTASMPSPIAASFAVLQILLVSSQGILGSPGGEQESTRHSRANKTGWTKHQVNAHECISGKYPRGFNFPSKVSGNSTASSPPLLFILFLLISNIMELNPLAISSGKKQPSLDSKWPD